MALYVTLKKKITFRPLSFFLISETVRLTVCFGNTVNRTVVNG